MAALQLRHGSYRVIFRYHGKQHAFTLGEVSKDEAEAKSAQVDYLLMRLKQRLVAVPAGMDIVEYVQFDGKAKLAETQPLPEKLTLAKLRDRYLKTHDGSLEPVTLSSIRIHFKHIVTKLGEGFPIAELSLCDLQAYVDHRAQAAGTNGRRLSPATIRKEIVTLRTTWNWARRMNLVVGSYPNVGLRYPRSSEKPPFQTLAEIERRIKFGVTEAEKEELYESLYLQIHETSELLSYVAKVAGHGFIYPMFCMAAHTGARRSELLRMRITDIDLEGRIVTVREKKRVTATSTTRRVPMSAFLTAVMTKWLADHPGGPWLFCHEPTVAHSRKRSPTTGHLNQKRRPTSGKSRKAPVQARDAVPPSPLTKDEASHHFRSTVDGSKWQVLRGWHTLRHSFVSACASRGVDQRLVEAWAGHMTKEMSRRYAHLYPSVQQQALAAVFDAA